MWGFGDIAMDPACSGIDCRFVGSLAGIGCLPVQLGSIVGLK